MSIKTWDELTEEEQQELHSIIRNPVLCLDEILSRLPPLLEKTTKINYDNGFIYCDCDAFIINKKYCSICGAKILWDKPKKKLKELSALMTWFCQRKYSLGEDYFSKRKTTIDDHWDWPVFKYNWFQYCGKEVPEDLIPKMHEEWLE